MRIYTCMYILNLGFKGSILLADTTLTGKTLHFIFISNSSIVTLYLYKTSLSFFLKEVYCSNNIPEINFVSLQLNICYISVCYKFNLVIKRNLIVYLRGLVCYSQFFNTRKKILINITTLLDFGRFIGKSNRIRAKTCIINSYGIY